MNITVIGCGRWGSFIAYYLDSIGHKVTLYGRKGSNNLEALKTTRTHGTLTLPVSVTIADTLDSAFSADIVVISIASQGLRSLMPSISGINPKAFVLCMKGLEEQTGSRLTEIVNTSSPVPSAVWVGPGHVEDFLAGIPNCMVIDSENAAVQHMLIEAFSSELIRFYYGDDLIGNEVGAAAKNVIGIAAGMLDGLGRTALKGALISRGAREISRLIAAMGGNAMTAYGLAHLGDYQATLFSPYSHNRAFGETFVRSERYESLAEGVSTTKALVGLSRTYGVSLPICEAVYSVLFSGIDPWEALGGLFLREQKDEQ